MKRLLFKSILFFLPFIVVLGVELFVLPVDFFTFRAWEALVVVKFKRLLPGPFYPGMELQRIEEGDLGHHTVYSVRKKATWRTDRYGYRTSVSATDRPRVVIIGDSNTVGTGLTQSAILSEVLAEKLNWVVYPFAPVSVNSFFKERRFMENPPKIVVFESIERDLVLLSRLKESHRMPSVLRQRLLEDEMIHFAAVLMERLWKMNMLQFLRAEIRRAELPPPRPVFIKGTPVLFREGAKANVEIPDSQREEVVRVLCSYREGLKKQGIRLIFLPVPNKENIYHRYLPGSNRPVFLERLISDLNEKGVDTIDTQEAFEEAFRRGIRLYLEDDTHWSAEAVQIAAGLIADRIRQEGD
jgi:alginate O-acetyltransferase complex protein AlgJ